MKVGIVEQEGFVKNLVLLTDNGLKLYSADLLWSGKKESDSIARKFIEFAESLHVDTLMVRKKLKIYD